MRSIVKPGKFDELQCVIQAFPSTLHVVVITETWIKSDEEGKRFQIPGYAHYYNFRTCTRGGGVSIFIKNNLQHSLSEEICLNNNHFLWIHIENYDLDIGAVYRKPDHANIKTFLETYSQQLHKRKRGVVFGDFNFNVLNKERTTNMYKDVIQENGYEILNKINENYCTRESTTSKSIIDHVCSNLKQNNFHMAIVDTPMSDHKQIYLELKRYQPEPLKKKNYHVIDYEILYKTILESQEQNQDCLYESLEEKLIKSIEISKITKIKTLNPPRQDWINKTIIGEINRRNTLWNQHKKNPKDKQKKEIFIKKRNEVSDCIRRTKSKYYVKAFDNCKKQPLKMWKLINSLSCNKSTEHAIPRRLQSSDGIVSDPKEICECFNDFFANVGSILANQIPTQHHPSGNQLTSSSESHTTTLTNLEPTTADEILKIINNLNNNTSSGLEGITTKSLKSVAKLILEELTSCINKCMKSGTFPDSLKIAKVTPIYKSGVKSEPGNYRPISVLPVLSKIFEKVLYNRLEKHLLALNFLYDKQYGFRPKSNTLSATIDLVTNLKLNIDNKQIGLGVFIDLKKAFDTVSHELLLNKLNAIGIKGPALDIFRSYLSNRYQVVKIGDIQSDPKIITYGVPQGSILAPLLFLLYINSVHQIGLKGNLTLYADDTCLFYFGHSIDRVINEAQSDLDLLNLWFQQNLLTINTTKTNYIIFAAKNKKIGNYTPLKINNQNINKVDHEKYLGLILDSKLTWLPHIQKIKSKLQSLTGTLRGIVRCLPRQIRYLIYFSLVKPHIDYLVEIWGSAAKTHINLLQIAQNKLLKTLFNYDYLTPTQSLYEETKLMNITQTYIYNTCILIRKILNKNIHSNITFTKRKKMHKMNLRREHDLLQLYSPRTNYGRKSIMYEGSKLYNTLPKYITESKSIATFKKLLKEYITKKSHFQQ